MNTPHYLMQWVIRNNISRVALDELLQLMVGETNPVNTKHPVHSEAYVQSAVILEASRNGARLFRNNVGACKDERGRVIRYGLCNESKQINSVCKSSDLIGIKPLLITPDMVGSTLGQFVAREVKKPSWQYKGNDHEQGQLSFLNIITALGGDAQFVNEEGTL